MTAGAPVLQSLAAHLGDEAVIVEPTVDDIPTAWVPVARTREALAFLSADGPERYRVLYDLTAIDERNRQDGGLRGDFTLVYHLLSYDANADVRLKVPLAGEYPETASVTDLWPAADWYEREVYDMFGVRFDGHPDLRRILMPEEFTAFPLRKDYPMQGRGERHNFPVITRSEA
jgi:NADH-quinone oxidoreductase subunit C/D